LNANPDLVDAGLVQTMVQVAEVLEEKGDRNAADFLIHVAHQLAEALGLSSSTLTSSLPLNLNPRLIFLMQVLQATYDSDGEPQVVYPLLQANLDKLDDNFASVLQSWATAALQKLEQKQALSYGALIVSFSRLLREFPLGNWACNLEIAITGYEVVAKFFPRKAFPEEWAENQTNLGNAYGDRIRGDRAQNLETAIRCYEAALEIFTHEAFPFDWSILQNNLGEAYRKRIRGDRAENLEEAIRYYEAALEVHTRLAFPSNWATTQNNLGNAYGDRIRGERAENLEAAIRCYEAALEVRTRSGFPFEWASIQNNLGTTYCDRIWGERAENLDAAIHYYNAALEVYTRSAFPQYWAITQNNLGSAYSKRIRGERTENLEAAIRCYEAVLEVYTRQAFPYEWSTTQHNLGDVYFERIQGEKEENLEAAICFYKAALEIRTHQAFPQAWADTRTSLGNAYFYRIRGKKEENLEGTIRCYEAALKVFTRQGFPSSWAATTANLGNAYLFRIWGERAENLKAAIACYSVALKVFTRKAYPENHARIQFNLGRAYQDTQQFCNAYNAFTAAIDTIEFLRGEIVRGSAREEDKQKLAEEYNQIYQRIVEVCLKLGYYDQAIEYVERSKARNLVELLATRDLYPKGDIPETVLNQLDRLRREIAAEQRRIDIARSNQTGGGILSDERSQFSSNSPTVGGDTDRTRVNTLQQQLNDLITQQIQPIDPTFSLTQRVEPISFQQIQDLLPDDKTALIEWYITDNTFSAFIITHQSPGIIVWQSSLKAGQILSDWGKNYLQHYSNLDDLSKQHWKDNFELRLNQLAQILHLEEVLTHVPDTCDRLILIPHLFLHLFPLHALPLPNQKDKCLLDKFPRGVRYAPSCQLLQLTEKQERPDFSYFFGVQNPTEDLFYANLEVQTIHRFFELAYVLIEKNAKKDAFSAIPHTGHLRAAHCVHFSCHSEFNFESPLKSALLLADRQPLTLGEIFGLDLSQCRLVTLSACETGLTDFTSISDEYIGLPSAFLYAGTLSVVSSLWAVNDLSTCFLTIKFYENLRNFPKLEAGDVAIALNQAQKWLRDLTSEDFEAVFVKYQPQIDGILAQLSKGDRFEFHDSLNRTLDKIQAPDRQPKPFVNPYYWAAFTATGL
jgi:CHAT domain-containing protein